MKKINHQIMHMVKAGGLYRLSIVALMMLTSCTHSSDPAPVCTSGYSLFDQLYNANAPGNHDEMTYDSEIHSYTFEVSTPKTICSIGYQSQPALATVPYVIEISINGATTPVFSANFTFSSVATSYQVLSTPLLVTPGNSYTIRRIQTSYTNIGDIIGRVLRPGGTAFSFPITQGDLRITGTSLYQHANTANNVFIPFIDIVFQ